MVKMNKGVDNGVENCNNTYMNKTATRKATKMNRQEAKDFIQSKAEQYKEVYGDLNGFIDSFPFNNTVGFQKNTLPIIKSVLNK